MTNSHKNAICNTCIERKYIPEILYLFIKINSGWHCYAAGATK